MKLGFWIWCIGHVVPDEREWQSEGETRIVEKTQGRCATTAAANASTAMLHKVEGRPFGVSIQVEASNHPKLLWAKAMV